MATDSLPGTAAVGRVALTVTDIAEIADFYDSVVGLDIVSEGDDRVVLGAGDRPLLVLERDHEAPERPREAAGLFHTAFRVPNRAALADALARVESEWTLAGASDHRVSEALYLWDPEVRARAHYRQSALRRQDHHRDRPHRGPQHHGAAAGGLRHLP